MEMTTDHGVHMSSFRMTQVTALVLTAVGAGRRYGFDVIDATGLASGTVYPVLRRLERARMLRGRWEEAPAAHRSGRPQRRLYVLTKAGEEALEEAGRKLASQRTLFANTAPVSDA